MIFPAAGPPYVSDHVRGRRSGTMADLDDFVAVLEARALDVDAAAETMRWILLIGVGFGATWLAFNWAG